jgi:alginate O-acetyltransferase complex protein AlgI
VAGPKLRARHILRQLAEYRRVSALQFLNGSKLIVAGFFMKLVLADHFGTYVDHSFGNLNELIPGFQYWFTALCFTAQIYFDFNGYTCIARGLAKWAGIHFKMNFNHPYFSTSFREFWQKWHISLSSWFKDYVYISLGGNRKGKWVSHGNMWIAMLTSGLWHGANLTFVAWGGLHALLLSLERLIKPVSKTTYGIFVFCAVVIAWVFFRSATLTDAIDFIANMFYFPHFDFNAEMLFNNALVVMLMALVFELGWKWKWFKKYLAKPLVQAFYLAVLVGLCVYFRGPETQFIYFQF